MIINWSKDGNISLEVNFDKINFRNLFRIESSNPRKGVDSYYVKNIWIFGFKFTYINIDYDDIVFVKIEPDNNYTNDPNYHKIKVFKETLNYLVKTNSYYNQKLPFNWNYYIDDNNGEITYFITAPKYFFEKNGLNALIHGLREITFNDEDYIYFQKYNPYKTEKVNRIYNYISDEDNEEEQ